MGFSSCGKFECEGNSRVSIFSALKKTASNKNMSDADKEAKKYR